MRIRTLLIRRKTEHNAKTLNSVQQLHGIELVMISKEGYFSSKDEDHRRGATLVSRGGQDAWRVFCPSPALERISKFGYMQEASVGPRLRKSELQIWTQLKVYRARVAGQAAGARGPSGVESAIKAKHYITIAVEGWSTRRLARRLLSAEISDRLKIATQPINHRAVSRDARENRTRVAAVSLIGNFVTLVWPLSIVVYFNRLFCRSVRYSFISLVTLEDPVIIPKRGIVRWITYWKLQFVIWIVKWKRFAYW